MHMSALGDVGGRRNGSHVEEGIVVGSLGQYKEGWSRVEVAVDAGGLQQE